MLAVVRHPAGEKVGDEVRHSAFHWHPEQGGLAVYRRIGFSHHHTDRAYRRASQPATPH